MQEFERNSVRRLTLPAIAMALALGGCSGTWEKLSEAAPRASDFTNFDWNPYSRASSGGVVQRLSAAPAAAAELVNPDGSCAGMQTQSADGEPTAAVPTGGAVALQMTECAVVRVLGMPEKVDLAGNERGERLVKLLYMRGEKPGLYTFTAGLLTGIDRVEVPEPPKPQKKPAPAKPALRRTT